MLGSIVALDSPLGSKAREILASMRTGGTLPSDGLRVQIPADFASETVQEGSRQEQLGGFASLGTSVPKAVHGVTDTTGFATLPSSSSSTTVADP